MSARSFASVSSRGLLLRPRRAAVAAPATNVGRPNPIVDDDDVALPRRRRVAVVGGGVVGLSTALRLAEEGRSRQTAFDVSVLARGFGDETTSSGAGGLWEPYKLGETPPELVNRWAGETLDFLLEAARGREGEGGRASGVIEGDVFQYWTSVAADPSWASVAPGFRRLTRGELELAGGVAERGAARNREGRKAGVAVEAPGVVDGWTFRSAAAQPSLYLRWLARRARAAGVSFERRELRSLEELLVLVDDEGSPSRRRPLFDAVVNCAGLDGGKLSKDDPSPPTPVRGQVARLLYPSRSSAWEGEWRRKRSGDGGDESEAALSLFLDEETYLIKNVDFVVAGGTGQVLDADATPRREDRESILARVSLLSPSLVEENLQNAEKVEDWVGLRPLRSPVRLDVRSTVVEVEKEKKGDGGTSPTSNGRSSENERGRVLVVNNYGHGGSGFTLHWGCARDAVELVLEGLEEI